MGKVLYIIQPGVVARAVKPAVSAVEPTFGGAS
jgi:hypothetical protein